MVYDENLAVRIRATLPADALIDEHKMFGGLVFMLDGHMCCGVVKDSLMLRLGPERAERALAEPHVRPMDLTKRPMPGMVLVDPPGLDDAGLQGWVDVAAGFARQPPARRP
ncbi:TfoX/Sxy family protein [Pengzhenrongella sicca]|uniref:TfoX/Sxy family protein n=1 Tax=Pengzhenrongella sicca TaxID=2819238 RepID=A0A8A4ZIU4_9MICO|nr:TfoX/Sxy family protein [Pengzhenrongella sicca]QTE30943.1 TfoX/Sxy family protein [Pengzhenrongella sicca]